MTKQKEPFEQMRHSNMQPMVLGELPGDLFTQNNVANQAPGQMQQYQAGAYGDIQRHTTLNLTLPQGAVGGETPSYPVHVQSVFDTRPINSREFILNGEVNFAASNVPTIANTATLDASATNVPTLQAFAYAQNKDKIYALNTTGFGASSTGFVSVINALTQTKVTDIAGFTVNDTASNPIVYVPLSGLVYVANSGTAQTSLSVIDPTTDTVTATISTGGAYKPQSLLYVPQNGLLYSYNESGPAARPSISVFNPVTGALVTTVSLPAGAVNSNVTMTYSPTSKNIYVPKGTGVNALSVFSTVSNTFLADIATATDFFGSEINPFVPSTNTVFYTDSSQASVYAVNTVSNSVVARIFDNFNGGIGGSLYIPSVNLVAVLSGGSTEGDHLFFIDPTTNTIVNDVVLSASSALVGFGNLALMSYNPVTGYVYISSSAPGSNTIVVFDPISMSIVATLIFNRYVADELNSGLLIYPNGKSVAVIIGSRSSSIIPAVEMLTLGSVNFSATGTFTVPVGFVAVIRDFRYEIAPLVNYDINQVSCGFETNGSPVPFQDVIHLGPVVQTPQTTHIIVGETQVIGFTVTVAGQSANPQLVNILLHGEFLPSHGLPPNYEVGSQL